MIENSPRPEDPLAVTGHQKRHIVICTPEDPEVRIRGMKRDIYGSMNEIDRAVELVQQMLHELRMDLVRLRIAENEFQKEYEDL